MMNKRINTIGNIRFSVFVSLVMMMAVYFVPANAEGGNTKLGLSASLQSDQFDIMIPIRSEKFAFVPAIAFASVSDVATDLGFGAAVRFHMSEGKIVPYAGFRVAVFIMNPKNGDSLTDYAYGPNVGGEYFLDDRFSIGIEGQVNITKSDEFSNRFGNPNGTNINTASSIFATFYF